MSNSVDEPKNSDYLDEKTENIKSEDQDIVHTNAEGTDNDLTDTNVIKTDKDSAESNIHDENKKNPFAKQVRDYAISIGLAIIIALTLRTYVFARADVEGLSMYSTLNDKDVLFVEKISLLTHNVKRGQIVIFDSRNQNNDIFVKRVIGVEGDTIELKDGKAYLNGNLLKEDYLKPGTVTNGKTFLRDNTPYTVKTGEIFVMGDNREYSLDSREIGPISLKDVKGHAFIRIYPFNTIKGL